MTKQKRVNKTEQELVQELIVKKQRQLIKEKLYPFLLSNTESIDDAKVFISACAIVIKQQFLSRMKDTKVADLKLKNLQADASAVRRYNDLFDIVADYSITDAITLIEGMVAELDATVKKELESRKLETLKVELL